MSKYETAYAKAMRKYVSKHPSEAKKKIIKYYNKKKFNPVTRTNRRFNR